MIRIYSPQLRRLNAISTRQLQETITIRELLTRAVRLLEKIAGNTQPPVRTPVSFHLSVSGQSPE